MPPCAITVWPAAWQSRSAADTSSVVRGRMTAEWQRRAGLAAVGAIARADVGTRENGILAEDRAQIVEEAHVERVAPPSMRIIWPVT